MSPYKIEHGQTITSRWGQWYRHDKVIVDGKPLDGFIQVRRRYYGKRIGHRIETTTCVGNACVMGHNVDWLIRNQSVWA